MYVNYELRKKSTNSKSKIKMFCQHDDGSGNCGDGNGSDFVGCGGGVVVGTVAYVWVWDDDAHDDDASDVTMIVMALLVIAMMMVIVMVMMTAMVIMTALMKFFYVNDSNGPVDFSSRPTSSTTQLGGKMAHSDSEEDEIDIVGEHHTSSQPMLLLRWLDPARFGTLCALTCDDCSSPTGGLGGIRESDADRKRNQKAQRPSNSEDNSQAETSQQGKGSYWDCLRAQTAQVDPLHYPEWNGVHTLRPPELQILLRAVSELPYSPHPLLFHVGLIPVRITTSPVESPWCIALPPATNDLISMESNATFILQLQKLRVVFTCKPKVARCTLLFVLRNPSAAKVATGGCESVHTQGGTFAAAAFDRVSRAKLWDIMKERGYPPLHLVKTIDEMHKDTNICIKKHDRKEVINLGERQGCL
ncbi:hypothetical protein ANN_04699 [Periplaneta americana]|uniref:Uncharacterized protein n=1 Tax=Periplaneta americana TaxID=6978 RepID=A0ABQ8T974_PERAM|nr:hypothetical protein ANN_04699 [Periplaneta americana]